MDGEVLREQIAEYNEGAMLADGFDEAILGVAERCSMDPVVIYDVDKMVEILMERDGMELDEAREYIEFNVIGAYVGEGTPMFLRRLEM